MDTVLRSLIVSASLGALIGLIRQWAEQQEQEPLKGEQETAGLRTFILWAILGYTAALISSEYSPFAFIAAMGIIGLHILLHGIRSEVKASIGLTTGAAALITYFIGALVFWNQLTLAVVLAALSMIVLGLKQYSHAWTRGFTPQDIRSTLQFVAVSGVILPLVPNEGFGPYHAINPYSLWWMVVLISGLGFVGYLLMRWLGARSGVILTGLIGGLASSTATTLAFSRESKACPELSSSFGLAIIMACTIMLGRVLIILGFIYPKFISVLWLPFTIMTLPGIVYGISVYLLNHKKEGPMDLPDLKNPLSLSIAIKFGLIYGVISMLVKLFHEMDLNNGLLALSFVSGLTDMDAIALSITNNLKDGSVSLKLAAQAVILAALANTLLKAGLVMILGAPQLRKQISIAFSGLLFAGVVGYFLI
jgi:uncharacterized membrane protein (DUF4010 family)